MTPDEVHPRSKKRKRCGVTKAMDSAPPAWSESSDCATNLDIEDLHDARCQKVYASIVPTQSAEDYPLEQTYDFANWRGNGSRIPLHTMPGTCIRRPPDRSRAAARDSEFNFGSKIVAAAHPTELHPNSPRTGPRQLKLVDNHRTLTGNARNTLESQPESRYQCLLDRVNPEYFAQKKYKWHSSTAQGPDTSEMMLIDPESAQDFTALYTSDNNISHQDMSQMTTSLADNAPEWTVPDLDGSSSPSKSVYSSPDSMLQPLPSFNRQGSDATSLELDAFEDVNQMFDWDGACASIVDDYVPDYKHARPMMARTGQYNTSLFRSIPTISARPYVHVGAGASIYTASHRMIESSRPSYHDMPHTMASQHADEEEGPSTVCHNCGVTKTPLWRRTPDKRFSLCNACGLYLKQYKTMRPLVPRNRSHVAKKDEENIVCTNCEATKTSLWRKDEVGQVICNACGLYFKLHGKARPVAMRKEKISRRKRYRNLASEMIDIHDAIPMNLAPVPQSDMPQDHVIAPAQA